MLDSSGRVIRHCCQTAAQKPWEARSELSISDNITANYQIKTHSIGNTEVLGIESNHSQLQRCTEKWNFQAQNSQSTDAWDLSPLCTANSSCEMGKVINKFLFSYSVICLVRWFYLLPGLPWESKTNQCAENMCSPPKCPIFYSALFKEWYIYKT